MGFIGFPKELVSVSFALFPFGSDGCDSVADPMPVVCCSLVRGILATSDLTFAVGIYGSKRSGSSDTDLDGASVDYFVIDRFGRNQSAPDVTKLAAGWAGSPAAGAHTFGTYICVGTLNDVRVEMRRLYVQGFR